MADHISPNSLAHFAWGLVWRHVDETTNFTKYPSVDQNFVDIKNKIECYSFFQIEIMSVLAYYFVPLVCIGLIGNLLCLLTFMTTNLRRISSSHYLAGLAVADSGVLLYIVEHNYWQLSSSPIICPLASYCGGIFCFLSAWFVVCFTIERFIAVRYPLKRPQWCTVSRARKVLISVFVFAAIFNLYLPVFFRSTTSKNNSECGIYPDDYEAFTVMVLIDAVLTFIIPFILIFFCNLMIIYTILHLKIMSDLPTSSDTATGIVDSTTIVLRTINETVHQDSRASVHRRLVDNRKITRVLLVVSFVYILCNFPDLVIRLVLTVNWKFLSASEHCSILRARTITLPLYGANFGVNFCLYCLVGTSFREHLIEVLRRLICFRRFTTSVL